ncbi:MAG: hypothetical protein VX684_07090, partial [Planctomycetota bacterium]|nr:hypothetical protein [Planctomycetota bacterium]
MPHMTGCAPVPRVLAGTHDSDQGVPARVGRTNSSATPSQASYHLVESIAEGVNRVIVQNVASPGLADPFPEPVVLDQSFHRSGEPCGVVGFRQQPSG